jgi:DNA polymerase III subunit beta
MKFVCRQQDLSANLALVSRAVASRASHPILTTIKIDAIPTNLIQLTGFDLSLGIQAQFYGQVEDGGSVALPAKLLYEIIAKLPSGDITIETIEHHSLVLISSSCGQYQIAGLDPTEFPELPTIDGTSHKLEVIDFIDGLRGTLNATSGDESKQILTGVYLNVTENHIEFAATDGHRLGTVEIDNGSIGSQAFQVTVPSKALQELDRILGRAADGDTLKIQLEAGHVIFNCGDVQLTTRTLEGKYPDYKLLIPGKFTRQVVVDRKLLLNALERIEVLSDHNNLVKFSINKKGKKLDVSIESEGRSGVESLLAQISGTDLDIAFNIDYFIDGLKILSTQEITISLNGNLEPVVLAPIGGVKMTYLVMPVQLRS